METPHGENDYAFSQSAAILTLALYLQACAQQAVAIQPTKIQPRLPPKPETSLTSTPDYAFPIDPELSRIAREVAQCILQYGEISPVHCDEGWPCQQRELTIDGIDVEAIDIDEATSLPKCTHLDTLGDKEDPFLPRCRSLVDQIELNEDIDGPDEYALLPLFSIDAGLDGNVDEARLPGKVPFYDSRRWGLEDPNNPGMERYCADKQNPHFDACTLVTNLHKRNEAQAQYRRQLLRVHAACSKRTTP